MSNFGLWLFIQSLPVDPSSCHKLIKCTCQKDCLQYEAISEKEKGTGGHKTSSFLQVTSLWRSWKSRKGSGTHQESPDKSHGNGWGTQPRKSTCSLVLAWALILFSRFIKAGSQGGLGNVGTASPHGAHEVHPKPCSYYPHPSLVCLSLTWHESLHRRPAPMRQGHSAWSSEWKEQALSHHYKTNSLGLNILHVPD